MDGIEEIPDDNAAWKRWAPKAQFFWVSDDHCGYERRKQWQEDLPIVRAREPTSE